MKYNSKKEKCLDIYIETVVQRVPKKNRKSIKKQLDSKHIRKILAKYNMPITIDTRSAEDGFITVRQSLLFREKK
jgi:hypothetical protein